MRFLVSIREVIEFQRVVEAESSAKAEEVAEDEAQWEYEGGAWESREVMSREITDTEEVENAGTDEDE